MTQQEASEHYNIPVSVLQEYERWGLCDAVKKVMGVWQYDDEDLERLSTIVQLERNAGWSAAHTGAEGLGSAHHRRSSAAEHDGAFPDGKKNVCKVRSLCNDDRS